MLETIREYARERLHESGEGLSTQRAHAAYLLVLAEEGTLATTPAEHEVWLRGSDAEHDNFRAALRYLIETGNAEWGLRLGGALFRFWEEREHFTEGRESLAALLAMSGSEAPISLRAGALFAEGTFRDIQGDHDSAEARFLEARDIYCALGDTQGVATVVNGLAIQAQRLGRYAESRSRFEETISLWQRLGETTAVDMALSNIANVAKAEGNLLE